MTEPPKPTSPRRVLVADDEHLVALGVASSLSSIGCAVVGPVADGQAAIEVCRAEQPDMALLDIRMPLVDGLACASTLWKELEIPSVIISAYSTQNYIDEAQQAGVFGYLLKPVTTESLRAAVSIAWSRASAHIWQSKRITQLEESLAVRRTVEMAKWKLIEARKVSEPEAHAILQKAARNERRRLVDVAQEVLNATSHALLKA